MFLSLEKYWLEFCISGLHVAESATTLSDNPMNLFVIIKFIVTFTLIYEKLCLP